MVHICSRVIYTQIGHITFKGLKAGLQTFLWYHSNQRNWQRAIMKVNTYSKPFLFAATSILPSMDTYFRTVLSTCAFFYSLHFRNPGKQSCAG